MTAKAPILASKPPASLTTASPPPSQSQEPTTYNEDQSEIKLQIPDIDKTMQVFLTHFATALAAKFSNELGKRPQYVRDDVSSDEDSESWSEGEDSRKGRGGRKKEKNKDDEKERTPAEMVDKLCKLDSIYDSSGQQKFVSWDSNLRGTSFDDDVGSDEYSKWVMVLRRMFERDNRTLKKTKLDIKSPLIKRIIKEVVKEEKAAMESEKASVEWPNENLFRYRKKIEEAAVKAGELYVKHIAVLMELIQQEFSAKIRDADNMLPKGTATYEILREAYWPGDLVVDKCSGFSRAYRIVDVEYKAKEWNNEYYLNVDVEYIDFNGEQYGTVFTKFRVPQYKGVKYLFDLPVFPLKYHPNKDILISALLAQGKKFISLKGQQFKFYRGICTVLCHCNPRRVHVDSRIMIDTCAFNRLNPEFAVSVRSIEDEIDDNNGELAQDHILILTNKIGIFSFQDKKFYHGIIDNVFDITFNDQVFNQLVLPPKQKDLVRVLVQNHHHAVGKKSETGDDGTVKGEGFDDFIEGKGKGLVAVLHGPPGVGKTMTAEAVAEFTRRPLYTVTSGELGTGPPQMETELERILDIAKTFRAVLLLDEADVFLEQRTKHDLIRNALVSIFLRQLEYYQGILFLTTNRVGTFDDAFHSRIHISLYYSNLSLEARQQVWRNFAENMTSRDPNCLSISESDYETLAKAPLNGRQIKNVFRTSQALAADKGEHISMEHMTTVLDIMSRFDLEKSRQAQNHLGMEQ